MKMIGASILCIFVIWSSGLVAPASAQQMVSPETLPCISCHDGTTLIVSKQAQFHHSKHGSGDAYLRGGSADCAGCHGSEASSARIAAGLMPHDPSVQGVVNVSPYTCRTCHDIHTSYTLKDFALTGAKQPVEMEVTGTIFDAGAGNLCASCHQIRVSPPVAENGQIKITSTRFGPHHGVEGEMLLGEGGMGVRSRPGSHYKKVPDTCVACHMGAIAEADPADPLPALARNHTFKSQVGYCKECHEEIKDFDYEGVRAEVKALMAEVQPKLIASGIMDGREGMENRSVPGTYPEDVVAALWNYLMVVEDGSMGMHHPSWTLKLLEASRDALSQQ